MITTIRADEAGFSLYLNIICLCDVLTLRTAEQSHGYDYGCRNYKGYSCGLCFLSYSEDAGTVRGDISADTILRYDPAALVYLVEVAAASAGSDFPVFFVLVFPLSTQGLVPPNDDFLRPL